MLGLGLGLKIGDGGAALSWTPNTAATPAVLWVRADGIALGSVSTWTDKSASGNNLSNVGVMPVNTAASGPKASQPAVIWAGTETTLSVANALVGTKNFTMVTVAKFTNTSAAHTIINAGSSATGWLMGVDVSAGANTRDLTAPGVVAIGDSTSNATTAWEAWIFESDASGNLTFSVNNVSHTLTTSNTTALTPAANFYVGSLSTDTGIMIGAIWEVIVFPTKLSAADRAQLVAYLSADTGLF